MKRPDGIHGVIVFAVHSGIVRDRKSDEVRVERVERGGEETRLEITLPQNNASTTRCMVSTTCSCHQQAVPGEFSAYHHVAIQYLHLSFGVYNFQRLHCHLGVPYHQGMQILWDTTLNGKP